ncbi:ATP-binding protein [Kangiella sediminilitoris]|uniref:histidine kinase n=1 Tax=Kangiella sediminilitoris TaxID=1144748 RepID=A0A1B3BBN5_9GAMM|nr:ATP-binding protein [Kangiella sediminilitoris]AOE50203.1 Histidine kinase [Kangiella sediminilitoris]
MKSLSLKWRIMLISCVFLLIPLASWLIDRKFESDLERDNFQQAVQQANNLRSFFEQLIQHDNNFRNKLSTDNSKLSLHVALRETGILVDGFYDEWYPYHGFGNRIENFGQTAELNLVEDQQHFFLLFRVEDDELVYRKNLDMSGLYDKVEIQLDSYRLQFAPIAPGRVAALRQTSSGYRDVTSIYAVWQESSAGYQLEVRVPRDLVGSTFSAEVHDVDQRANSPELQGLYSFTNFEQAVLNSMLSVGALSRLKADDYRVMVTNLQGDIVYGYGQPHQNIKGHWRNRLWLSDLSPIETRGTKVSLSSEELDKTLMGKAQEQLINPGNLTAYSRILEPLYDEGNVVGALIVESSAINEKLYLRDFWLRMLLLMLLFWVLMVWWLYRSSKDYSRRIVELRDITEEAVSEQGQIRHVIEREEYYDDEVADLTNTFSQLTTRLKQHHDYQEKLVARLNHELRTPIAIIRSSLDNLSTDNLSELDAQMLHSAQSGASRMSQTLSRLSEATRLEQAIKSAEKYTFNVNDVLKGLSQAYATNWPDHRFEYQSSASDVALKGSKDLFVQMVDKLITNAVDFDDLSSPIRLSLREEDSQLIFEVSNRGALIERKALKSVFSLMHSSRKNSDGHLGLGLYLAKLIANFHNGHIVAKNHPDNGGVSIIVSWKNKYFTHQ